MVCWEYAKFNKEYLLPASMVAEINNKTKQALLHALGIKEEQRHRTKAKVMDEDNDAGR